MSQSRPSNTHILVFDSSLQFIKGKSYQHSREVAVNNIAQFNNGDYLISETLNYQEVNTSTLVRTLPDLSKPSCKSLDFIPNIETGVLIVTDITHLLAYTSNFPQTDSVLRISVQNRKVVSLQDCSYNPEGPCDTSLCSIYKLSGVDKICHLSDTLKIILNKNANCNLVPAWNTSGTAGYEILSQSDSVIKIKITSNGNVLVKVRSLSSCKIYEDSLATEVNISPSKIDLGPDITLCTASTIQLHAGSGFKSYLWQDGSVDSTFTAYLPGTYFVTAIDHCGNYYSDSIHITLAQTIAFDLGADKEICVNDSITISAPPGFSNYIWSPDYAIDTIYGPTVKIMPLIDTMYSVTAIKAFGCIRLDSIRIKVHPVKNTDLSNDTSFCFGESIILNAGSDFISYQWSTGSTNQAAIASLAGSYSVAATDINGCIAKDTINILNIYPKPIINLGNDKNLCQNSNIILNAGSGFQNYIWKDNSIKQTFTVHKTGQYWVKVKDNHNCIASDTINITIVPNPIINLGADTSFCIGQTILLSPGTGYINYTWQDHSKAQSFVASQPGQYSVIVIDTNKCSAADTLKIIALYPKPILNIGNDTVLCKGQSITLNAGSGFAQYLWQNNSNSQFFNANAIGYYWAKVTDSKGCFDIDTLLINIISPPKNFVSTYNICETEKKYIKPVGRFNSYLWSDGTTSDSVLILIPGNYWLIVKDNYGCEAKENFEVVKKNCLNALYFPNAFTPNTDNLNDSFKPKLSGNLEQYHLEIYNRYGKKIFESNDITKGWNGNSNNLYQDSGVYIWVCKFKLKNHSSEIQKGTFVLIR